MRNISKNLWSLFWTQFFGALNDNLFKNALVILITYKNINLMGLSAGSLVAFCGGIFILPFFFLSATSGQLADRFDKAMLVKIIKKAEIGIVILGMVGLFFSHYPLLLFVLFLFGLHSTFFGPLKYSLIPNYSTPDQLIFANAMISSGTFSAILIGTILGGLAVSFGENTWFLKALLLIVAILGVYFGNKLPEEKKVSSDELSKPLVVDWNFYTSTRDILKMVFQNQSIAGLVVGLSWFWFLGAGLLSLIPGIAKDVFHGHEVIATLMLFTFTMGMGLGPFFLEKCTKGVVFRFLIPLSLICMSLIIFDLAYVLKAASKQSFLLMLLPPIDFSGFFKLDYSLRFIIDLFLLSFSGGVFTVVQFAELQRIVESEFLSRVFAGNNIINSMAMVSVSVLLMIFHSMHFSFALMMGILGGLNLLMCMGFLFLYKEDFNRFWKF